jgi:hypothetical protein
LLGWLISSMYCDATFVQGKMEHNKKDSGCYEQYADIECARKKRYEYTRHTYRKDKYRFNVRAVTERTYVYTVVTKGRKLNK